MFSPPQTLLRGTTAQMSTEMWTGTTAQHIIFSFSLSPHGKRLQVLVESRFTLQWSREILPQMGTGSCRAIYATVKELCKDQRSQSFCGGYSLYWLQYMFITFTILNSILLQLEYVLPWGGFYYGLHTFWGIAKDIHSVEYPWWCTKLTPLFSSAFPFVKLLQC